MAARLVVALPEAPSPTASVTDATSVRRDDASDELLLSLICEGDNEALALLFRRYARLVRGVAYRILRDRSEADDLLQDIFLLIPRRSGYFDSSKGSARSWILQITCRRAINRRRDLSTRHFYNRVDLDEVADGLADRQPKCNTIEQSIDGRFGAGTEEQLMAELSENQRQTLRLFFIEGHTFDEIALKLGQTQGNIRHHYFRGLDRLRRALGTKIAPQERSMIQVAVEGKERGVAKRTP